MILGALGDLVEDVVVWLDEPLAVGTDTAGAITRTRGGSAANVAAAAARLGDVRVRYLGCVGADDTGDALVAGLEHDGVEVRVQRRGHTGTIVVLVDQHGERSMVPDRGASLLVETVPDEWLDGLGVLHIPAYGFCGEPVRTTVLDALARARARGIVTSIDASSVGALRELGRDAVLELLRQVRPDHLLANEDEACYLGLAPGLLPDTVVVLKHGPEPTVALLPGGGQVVVPAVAVAEVRDTTGAGDAFAAGYLATILRGADVADACATGNAWAARTLAVAGAL